MELAQKAEIFRESGEKSGKSAQQLPHKEIALEICNVWVKKMSCDRTGMNGNHSGWRRKTKFPVHHYMDRMSITDELKHKEINFTTVVCRKLLANSHTFHHVLDLTDATNIIKTVQLIFLILVYVPLQANFLQWCANVKRDLVVKMAIPSLLSLAMAGPSRVDL